MPYVPPKIGRAAQERLLDDLLRGLAKTLHERMDRVPGEWDGQELRQWIIDVAAEELAIGEVCREPAKHRARAYRNARLVNNL